MSEHVDHRHAPRPRALAEMALDSSAARAEELARRWAVAMILDRPLQTLGDLPLAELASAAPSLCAQVLLALQSDGELDRLTGEGAPAGRGQAPAAKDLRAVTGAQSPGATVATVEALRGVVWQALLEDLGHAPGERAAARYVADAADRLAYVCARLLTVALVASGSSFEHAEPSEDVSATARATPVSERPWEASQTGVSSAVIFDERAAGVPVRPPVQREVASGDEARGGDGERAARGGAPERPVGGGEDDERPLSWDASPPVVPGAQRAEIQIRDERIEGGPAAWIGSIGRQLERFAGDAVPFAVMLLEPVDLEQLAEMPGELRRVDGELGKVLARALGPMAPAAPGPGARTSPSMTRESPGRYWMLVPRGDARAAAELAERLLGAAAAIADARGLRLELAIGTAVCPSDGRDAPALAAHADIALYAARSAKRALRMRVGPSVDEPA